jgi:hypothetical protein
MLVVTVGLSVALTNQRENRMCCGIGMHEAAAEAGVGHRASPSFARRIDAAQLSRSIAASAPISLTHPP